MKLTFVWATYCALLVLPTFGLSPSVKVPAGRAPFVVSLQKCYGIHCSSHCTGALLSESMVLTAASCAWSHLPLKAVAGVTNLPDNNGRAQKSLIMDFWIHEDYNEATGANNIMILKLEQPFELGRDAQPMNIPIQGEAPSERFANLYGYSRNNVFEGPLYVANNQKIIPSRYCKSIMKSVIELNSIICTMYSATTVGDQGGPLVQDGLLIGIASFNTSDGVRSPSLAIVTPTNLYSDWIREVIRKN